MTLSSKEVFKSIRDYCLKKDGAVEEYPWGDVAWKVNGKMFACSSDGSNCVTVKTSLDEQAVLVQHPSIEIAHYVGRFGWVTIRIADRKTLKLTESLIDGSYDAVRPKAKKRAARPPA